MCQDNSAVEDPGRSVPRCPARTASRCPRRSAPVFPDNSASQCRGRYPGNSALIHHNSSAAQCQGSSALQSQGSNVKLCREELRNKDVLEFHAKSVGLWRSRYLNNNARKCQGKSATVCPGSSARVFQDSSAVLPQHKTAAVFQSNRSPSSVAIFPASNAPPPTLLSARQWPVRSVFLSASQYTGARSVLDHHPWNPPTQALHLLAQHL